MNGKLIKILLMVTIFMQLKTNVPAQVEELKRAMDLGYAFSREDIDSSLMEI